MNHKIKPAIIVFPGSNCERDMDRCLRDIYHLDPIALWHNETLIPQEITHIILPGGFSYGDYLRAGALAAISPIMKAIKKFAHDGRPVLGICNGFQILCEARLLPGVLLRNHHDRFICSILPMTWLGRARPLLEPIKLSLPIAHRDGRFHADSKTLDELRENHRIALIYDDKDAWGNARANGSAAGIAGIVDGPGRNIFGLMPHPERILYENGLARFGSVILQDFLFGQDNDEKALFKLL
jgi:phosphoribosylformylglycinamidine synthase I